MGDEIGDIVKDRRVLLGLSQEAVADKTGTSSQQIGKLERGEARMTVDWLRKLATALECRVVDLLAPSDKGGAKAPANPPAIPADKAILLAALVHRTLRSYYRLARERFDQPPAPEDFAREYSRQFESLVLSGKVEIDDASIEVASGVAVTALRYAVQKRPRDSGEAASKPSSDAEIEELEETDKGPP